MPELLVDTGKVHTKQPRVMLGWDGSNYYPVNISADGGVRVRNTVWDSGLLSWVAMTQPDGGSAPSSSAQRFNAMSDDGTYQYFGFSDGGGAWTIKRLTVATNEMRYASGSSDYATAWANRASQTYGY